jgi:hypothetical protein
MKTKTAAQSGSTTTVHNPETNKLVYADALALMANYCKANNLPTVRFKAKTGPRVTLLNLAHTDNRGILSTDMKKIHAFAGIPNIWIAKTNDEITALNFSTTSTAA